MHTYSEEPQWEVDEVTDDHGNGCKDVLLSAVVACDEGGGNINLTTTGVVDCGEIICYSEEDLEAEFVAYEKEPEDEE